jgi:predicted lipoprotein with Yx(FWY)xxD motif
LTTTRERCEDDGPGGPCRPGRLVRSAVALSGLGVLALVVVAAVVGWNAGIDESDSAANAAGAVVRVLLGTTPSVEVASNTTYGNILTTGTGLALYTLDTDHGGQSTCTGACAAAWPALTVATGTTPTGGSGMTGTLGVAEQSNGTSQVTYSGSLLYTFEGDTPGQVTGEGVNGFSVVSVASVTTTTTTTTTTTSPPTTTTPPTTVTTPTTAALPAGASGTTPTSGSPGVATASSGMPAGATETTPTSGSPGVATASAGTPATTGKAPTSASESVAASSGTLASTGPGPGLKWLFVIGLILMILGLFGRVDRFEKDRHGHRRFRFTLRRR